MYTISPKSYADLKLESAKRWILAQGSVTKGLYCLILKVNIYFPQVIALPALLLSAFLGGRGGRGGDVVGSKRGGGPMLAGSRGILLEGNHTKNMINLWDLVRGSVQKKGCEISNNKQGTLTMIYKTMCATKYETKCTDSYK